MELGIRNHTTNREGEGEGEGEMGTGNNGEADRMVSEKELKKVNSPVEQIGAKQRCHSISTHVF